MEINILSGSNAPETTNVLMGMYNGEGFNIDVTTLTGEDLIKWEAFMSLVGNMCLLNIIDTPYELSGNRVVPSEIIIGETELGYNTFSQEDKDIIDNFGVVIMSLIN